MSRPPFWLAALVLAGCATSKSAESQLQLSGKEDTAKTFKASEVIQEDTGGWTRKTWEFAPKAGRHRAGGGQVLPASPAPDLPASPAAAGDLPDHGPLLKYTEETHDPSTKKTTLQAKGTTERLWETAVGWWAKARSTVSYWPPLYLWLLGLAALAAAAWFFKPPLLLKLLARIFP